ncbi:MAG: hypothetical protein LBM75_09400 [Myxococcales bacterium]|jgi:hypothetical protein|nr:hypothetical protein [Myxococcales bacterium]
MGSMCPKCAEQVELHGNGCPKCGTQFTDEELKTPERQKVNKGCAIGCLSMILIPVFIGTCMALVSTEKSDAPYVTTAETPERLLEDMVRKKFGIATNWHDPPKPMVIGIEISPDKYGKDTGFAKVMVWVNDNFTTKARRELFLTNSAEFSRDFFKEKAFSGLSALRIEGYVTLVDVYGNPKDFQGVGINIPREVAEKINWDYFNTSDFPEIIKVKGSLEMHPTLLKD